jgi:predicted esterase
MHGLGDSGQSYREVFEHEAGITLKDSMRIVLPTAPSRPVSTNNGMPMNSWFDIRSLDVPEHLTKDLRESMIS